MPDLIYLTGFMGAGKTSVGRSLARRLRRPFVDLDSEVERAAGRPIRELFQRGERSFRRLESAALRRAAARKAAVVALGGGTLLRRSNRLLVRKTGLLVSLSCSEAALWSRLRPDDGKRPLLGAGAGRRERLRRLLARRRGLYRDADRVVSTTRRTPAQAAAQIGGLL
ncbi:MAG: shikimate kinase [Elusimicrobia bacterium]|nr:shikimate kinase [Elusimicrobiota bacterium]